MKSKQVEILQKQAEVDKLTDEVMELKERTADKNGNDNDDDDHNEDKVITDWLNTQLNVTAPITIEDLEKWKTSLIENGQRNQDRNFVHEPTDQEAAYLLNDSPMERSQEIAMQMEMESESNCCFSWF